MHETGVRRASCPLVRPSGVVDYIVRGGLLTDWYGCRLVLAALLEVVLLLPAILSLHYVHASFMFCLHWQIALTHVCTRSLFVSIWVATC